MILKQIIKANPDFIRTVNSSEVLSVSELFCNTIQGENFVGYPATFLRLQFCVLNCIYCDTKKVWKYGNPYSINEILQLLEENNVICKLQNGQHLILTGGSPLIQQNKLVKFIVSFMNRYSFKPYIEIENECTILPLQHMISFVDCWNNSPKLSNSGNKEVVRYKPDVLRKLSSLKNSWFKFVVDGEEDWEEINEYFLQPKLIQKNQIVLMPCAETREELEKTRLIVVEMAIEHDVRYTTREHIVLWGKKIGV